MARQRRTLDEQISELVTRGRSSRTEVQSVPAMAAIGSEMITGGAISQEHIQEGAVTPTAFSPEVRQVFDDLEGGLQGSAEAQRQLGEKITELKEVSLPALDKDLAASKERIEAIDGRLSPIDAGLALLQNQQIVVSDGIAELRDKTVPALSKDLESAAARLDSTDVLLNTTFPKLISDNLADAKADATTKANAAEAAAISAAASDAQTKADAAIAEALRLYEKAISSGSNMAADPSFEEGFGAYFNSTYFGTSTRKVAAGQARTGAAYLEVVQGSVATDAPSVRFRVSGITPGRVYAISAWAYRQTGGGSLSNSITGYFLNSAGTSLGWVPYVDAPTSLGTWSQAGTPEPWVAPAGASSLEFRVNLGGTGLSPGGISRVDDIAVYDVTDAKVALDAAKAAQATASAAQAAAGTAGSNATAALTMAGSKSKVYYNTTAATGTATGDGDLWRQRDSSNNIIAEWRWNGTPPAGSWIKTAISSDAISNLDVGKLTVGTAVIADAVVKKIAASTASIQQADIGNLTVTGSSKLEDLVASKIAADTGKFINIDIGTGTFGEMDGARIAAGTVEAQHLLVGSFGNLIPNGAGEWGKAGAWASNLTWDPTDKPDGLPGAFKGKSASTKAVPFDVEPNAEYKFEMWIKADLPNSRFYFEFRDQSGVFGVTNKAIPGQTHGVYGVYPVGNYTVPTTWTKLSAIVTTSATTSKLRVGAIYLNHVNGTEKNATVSMAGVRLIRRNDGTMIVNGSVAADQVDAASVGAAVGSFVKADIGNLVVSGTSKMDAAVMKKLAAETATIIDLNVDRLTATSANISDVVAEKMFSNIFATRKLYANQVYVGEGGNLFPGTDFMDSGWAATTNVSYSATGGKLGGSSATIASTTSQTGVYFANATAERSKLPKAQDLTSYKIGFWVKNATAAPKNSVAVYLRCLSATGANLAVLPVQNSEALAAGTWDYIEGIVKTPANTAKITLGVYTQAIYTGSAVFSDLDLCLATTPSLIVDGLMDGKRIVGASIETNKVADKGVKMTDAGVIAHGQITRTEVTTPGVPAAPVTYLTKAKLTHTVDQYAQGSGDTTPGLWFESRRPDGLGKTPTRWSAGVIPSSPDANGIEMRSSRVNDTSSQGSMTVEQLGVSATSGSVTDGYGSLLISPTGSLMETTNNYASARVTATPTGHLTLEASSGVTIQQGSFPATRIPQGILARWDASSAIVISNNTTILSQAVKVPPKATIRVSIHLGGYPSADAQYMDVFAYADGVEFAKGTHHSPRTAYGTDAWINYHFTSALTTEKTVTFRIAGNTSVPSSSTYTIAARAAGGAPRATIIFEDLGNA